MSDDHTWDAVEKFHWCFVEVNAAILCECAPALNLFFVRYLPGLLSSQFRSQGYNRELSKHPNLSASKSPASQSYSSCQPSKDMYELQWRNELYEKPSLTKHDANDDEACL